MIRKIITALVLGLPLLSAEGIFDIDVRRLSKLDPTEETIARRLRPAENAGDSYIVGYIGPEEFSWKREQRMQDDKVNNEAFLIRRLGPGKLSVREAVSTATAAMDIATALVSQVYPADKLNGQRPFSCRRVREFWVIEGKQDPAIKTHVYIALLAATGQCISIRDVGANLWPELQVPSPARRPGLDLTLTPTERSSDRYPWPFWSVN